jgi:hypothetical protein
MKRLYVIATALALGLGIAQPSWAIMINEGPHNGTDVGSVDDVIDYDNLANSGKAEIDWLQGLLPGAEILPQQQSVPYYSTDTSNVFAFLLDPEADYFMIKNATWHALFENNALDGWGVFDITDLPGSINLGLEGITISHVRAINPTTTTNAPEPSTLALLGLSMLGLAAARRRKQI